jgi:ribosomal protein S6
MMKYYDYTYLTRQDMPEDEAQKLQNRLVEMVTAQNGVIVDLPKAYKKRLAYRIKKQEAAFVNTVLFQSEAEAAVNFKKETDKMAEILRGLLISYDPEKLKKEIRRERPASAEKPAEIDASSAIAKNAPVKETIQPEKKVELEIRDEPETPKPAKEKKAKESKKEESEKTVKSEEKEEKKTKEDKKEETKEEKPKLKRRKIKAELRDIEEKLDEILK